ncbi:MAG: AAA family ATPase [Saprospiraceae bacterium]
MKFSFKGNKEAERVINLVKHTNNSVFLTGKAGTGKSTLLKHIISDLNKKYILLAPTGIAALNVGGQTIHSFFGFGFRPYLPKDRDLPNLLEKLDLLKKIDLIIIDEISMVRADVMNAIDLTLKKFLKNKSPFGGKQLLIVGDLLQLPPVVNNKNIEEVKILRENYRSEFFFDAPIFNEFDLEVIELDKVYRQEEKDFVKVLNNIRTNQATDADLCSINTRYQRDIVSEGVITLTTKNATVDKINSQKLSKIDKPEFDFFATKTGTFADNRSSKRNPTDDILKLKEGSQVIFVKNDSERKWVNGTIAKINKIEDNEIEVDINGLKCSIPRETWEDVEYKWNREEDKIEKEVVGTFEQYPIRLAWAITIHKSQGQTFEKSIVDMDTGAFAFGQTYVALSRCTSLEGICLTRKINRSDIKVSENAVKYLTEKGIDSLHKRDNLELDLIERIKELENNLDRTIEEKKSIVKKAKEKDKETENILISFERIKTENDFLKKEIDRVKGITWIQKLFGAK